MGNISTGETRVTAFVARPAELGLVTLILGGGDTVSDRVTVTLRPAPR